MGDLIFFKRVLDVRSTFFYVPGSKLPGCSAENQSFEQGIAAEPICTVQTGCSYLTTGVKIFDACLGSAVSLYAANHIVCAGSDRYQVPADIYVETFAEFTNQGESFCKMLLVEVPNVQVNVR